MVTLSSFIASTQADRSCHATAAEPEWHGSITRSYQCNNRRATSRPSAPGMVTCAEADGCPAGLDLWPRGLHSWELDAAFTKRIVADTFRKLQLGQLHHRLAKSGKSWLESKRQPSIERRVNPLLLPLRLLLALLRILLLPLRILLAPVILLLRALLRLLRLLIQLLNPLFYLFLALMVLNIGANIARIVLLILRLIFLRRLRKRKLEYEETRVITLDADSLPVEPQEHKSKQRKKTKKKPTPGKVNSSRVDLAYAARRIDGELEAKLIRSAQEDMIDKLRCLGLLSQLAPLWSTEAEIVGHFNRDKAAWRKLCNFHPQVLDLSLSRAADLSARRLSTQPELDQVIGV